MSQGLKDQQPILFASPRDFFQDRVETAIKRVKFRPMPLSRAYLVDLLEHFMFAKNLFVEDADGKLRRETLAEIYLRAQNSPLGVRLDLLKRLGDSSLYICGFFGDSLSRSLVDMDYYVGMGGTAYGALSSTAADEDTSQMYKEFSSHFAEFVDVLTYISQDAQVQTNSDLLKLYDRYIATGSRLAEEQLAERGLLNPDLQKTKNRKM